jgi:hypothetical protein
MKQFARDKQIIKLLLMGLLLLPFTLFGQQDEEEDTPAEKQSAKESQQSISIVGLDANPSKTLERIEVLRSTGKIDIKTYVEAVRTLDANPSKALERIEVLVSTGKIDNETFAKAIVAIIPNEAKAKAYAEELKASGAIPASVIDEVIEEITNVEVPPVPPSVLPPTAPPTAPTTPDPEPTDPTTPDPEPTDPTTPDPEPTDPTTPDPEPNDPTPPPSANSYSYDMDSDILTIPGKLNSLGKLETLQGVGITQSNLAGLGVDTMTSKTVPYLVEAYEFGNFSGSQHASRFNEILLEAVNLMNILIKSLEMTDQLNVAGSENLFDKDRLTEILDNRNPYFHQLVKVLANKGAFGDKNDGKVGDAIGKLLLSLFPAGATSTEVSDLLSNTLGELVFQKLSGNLGDLVDLTEFEDSQLFKMKADQVKGIVAQDIHLGSTSETTTIIDLTKQLKPSSLSPTNPKDWKVFGIGAGKDIVVKGNVSFKNSNRHPQSDNVVKDHALAIGALDEIHFHSKTIEADWGLPADFLEKHLDYSVAEPKTTANDPTITTFQNRTDRIKMEFEGANLYLGSISKMELVNVDLESGGNLGVASLDELHIVSSDPTNTPNTFTVGKNTNPSDRGDNIQLFANERIVADGLRFEGRVDSIYMEARTVDLKNVTFPNGSEVNLASELGGVDGKYPTFGINDRTIGRVNFIDNVKYDIIPIANRDSFDALGTLLNGKQPITISKR